jgi:hypothetical protein
MGWMNHCSNPGRGKDILKIAHTDTGADPASYSLGTGILLQG